MSEKNCNFREYGFEKPEFECEILKEDGAFIYGVVDRIGGQWLPMCWYKETGVTIQSEEIRTDYNLTPVKWEWYEIKDNFPCVVIVANSNKPHIVHGYNAIENTLKSDRLALKIDNCRLATSEEVNLLKVDERFLNEN